MTLRYQETNEHTELLYRSQTFKKKNLFNNTGIKELRENKLSYNNISDVIYTQVL